MTERTATMAIRPIAIGIFRRGDRILVGHGHDVIKAERQMPSTGRERPLGRSTRPGLKARPYRS